MTPLDLARQDIGYTEQPINRTKYGKWYGMDGQPWCVMCVLYWYAMSGNPLPVKTASSSALANWYKKNEPDKVVKDLQPMDICYMKIGSGHTVLVEKDNGDDTFTTVEGNTSPGTKGSQDNGGGVYRRVRKKSQIITIMRPLGGEEMSYEVFKEYMEKYMEELAKEEPAAWSKEAREWAEENGIIAGDANGSKQYKAYTTREQMVIFLKRVVDKFCR